MLSLIGGSPCYNSSSGGTPNSSRNNENVNDPPNLVRCTYSLSKDTPQDCGGGGGLGLQATTIICQKCARQEVQINASPPSQDDPCFTRIPKTQQCRDQDQGDSWYDNERGQSQEKDESCASRRKNYRLPHARHGCVPFTGPLTEYQEAYRKRSSRAGPRIYARSLRIEARPPWNPSNAVSSKPFQESLDSAEAKLRALDMFEDPTPDVMALAIMREQVKERYRAKRSAEGGGGRAFGNDGCCGMARSGLIRRGPICRPPPRQTAFVKGSRLELLETDSQLSEA